MFMVWILWKRKRFQRRKSQVSGIVTINKENTETSSSRPSTFNSSNRSLSPLINCSFEKESLDFGESARLGSLSTVDHAEDTRRTYTLKEVDKICMEALKGSKRVPSSTNKRNEITFDYNSTKKLFTSIINNNNKNDNNMNSQRRWDQCSSGYGSATSSITSSLHQR